MTESIYKESFEEFSALAKNVFYSFAHGLRSEGFDVSGISTANEKIYLEYIKEGEEKYVATTISGTIFEPYKHTTARVAAVAVVLASNESGRFTFKLHHMKLTFGRHSYIWIGITDYMVRDKYLYTSPREKNMEPGEILSVLSDAEIYTTMPANLPEDILQGSEAYQIGSRVGLVLQTACAESFANITDCMIKSDYARRNGKAKVIETEFNFHSGSELLKNITLDPAYYANLECKAVDNSKERSAELRNQFVVLIKEVARSILIGTYLV